MTAKHARQVRSNSRRQNISQAAKRRALRLETLETRVVMDYASAVQADNPVAFWRFESGQTLTDSAAAGGLQTLTATGSPVFGQPGAVPGSQAVRFNPGDGGDALTGVGTPMTASFTLELWAKSTGATWNQFGWLSSERNANGWILHPNPGSTLVDAYVLDGGGNFHLIGSFNPPDITQWHHYAITYDAALDDGIFYVDGVQVAFNGNLGATSRFAGSIDVELGRDDPNQGARFGDGFLDEVAVYNSVLTQAKLQAHIAAAGTLWTGAVNTNWSNPGNWLGGNVPDTAGETAVFGNTGAGAVTVDGTFTVGGVSFVNTAGSYVLGSGTLNVTAIDQGGTQTNTINSSVIMVGGDFAPGASKSVFTGGDVGEGLDLDGTFVYSVNIGGSGTATVRNANFTNGINSGSTPGVTFNGTGQISPPGWGAPNYGATGNDDGLELVMSSIRHWGGASGQLLVDLTNLVPGQAYKLQLLFQEACCAGRGFDVLVEGALVTDDYFPSSAGSNVTNGGVVTYSFIAGDTTANIVLDGVATPSATDHNPILDALTLELQTPPATITSNGGTLTFGGSLNLGANPVIVSGTAAVSAAGTVSGGAALRKQGTGTLTLSGNNNFSGPVTVEAGRVTAASNNALGTTGAGTTVNAGAELALSGGVTIAEPLTIGGTLRNLAGVNTVTSNITAQTLIAVGSSLGVFTGGDAGEGLDLDGTFLYAVNVGGAAVGAIRDANFTDGSQAGGTPGFTSNAVNQLVPGQWGDMEYGNTNNDNRLETVLESIRYQGAPSHDVTLANLVPGQAYKLQLLYQEACCTNRGHDVLVNGVLVADNFFPGGLGLGVSRVVTYSFVATSASLLISAPGTNPPATGSGDANSILSGLTLEAVNDRLPLTVLSDAGTLNLNGTVDVGNLAPSTFGGASEIIVNGNLLGSAPASITKSGTGALRINAQTPVGVPVTVAGGVLAGTGTIRGNVTVNSPGVLAAGSAAAMGTLTVNGNVAFNSLSTARARIAAASNDKLIVNGTVTLTGLVVPDITNFAAFNAATGQAIVLLQNDGVDPVSGTFALSPEGTLVSIGTNQYSVTYVYNAETATPGTGNDIALIATNRAPIANAGGPYSVTEGNSLVLNASGSSDPDGDTLTYSWDVNGDGVYGDATGVNPSLTWAQLMALPANPTPINDGLNPPTVLLNKVSVRVSDPETSTTSAYLNLTVVNGAPTAIVGGQSFAVPGAPYSLALSATDPSPVDQAAQFTYDVDWGDFSSDTYPPGILPATHVYQDFGDFTITVTVTDKDGGVSAPVFKDVTMVPVAKVGNDIAVAGTGNDEKIIFTPNNGFVNVRIIISGQNFNYGPFPSNALTKLIASGFGGSDTITVSSSKYGYPVVFNGGEGNDYLAGSTYDDTLIGEAGADRLIGGVGNDSLDGGDDNDSLDGGAGDDIMSGGAGNDKGMGGAGNDIIDGGDDNDSLDGGTGNDLVRGGAGFDTVSGAAGDDILLGGEDNDRMLGAAGNDVLIGGDGKDAFDAGAGDDLLITGTTDLDSDTDAALLMALDDWTSSRIVAFSTISGDGESETLTGGTGADLFYLSPNDKAKDFKATNGDVIEFV